jgi:hypothetical protein
VKLNTYVHLVLRLRMSGVVIILSLYAFLARALNTVVVEKYSVMIGMV